LLFAAKNAVIIEMRFVWEHPDWPNWSCEFTRLEPILRNAHLNLGKLHGKMEMLGLEARGRAQLEAVVAEALETCAIEGEALDVHSVRSSAARRLGLEGGGFTSMDRVADGVVEMVLDAMEKPQEPLTQERLWGWHAAIFPTGYSGTSKIRVAGWRDDAKGPMRIVSGELGREKVHYEAPPAERVPAEMQAFFEWINGTQPGLDFLAKAGRAHLWFEAIHPFDDGNGRIGRAIVEWVMARGIGGNAFFSMSRQLERERVEYYRKLETSSCGDLNDELWLGWFLGCASRAIEGSGEILDAVMKKAHFWSRWQGIALNERQSLMLNQLLDGFEGKLTSSKWAKITKCSADTALRDLLDLVERGVLRKADAGGRGSHYVFLNQDD
jgi:Fic family protein